MSNQQAIAIPLALASQRLANEQLNLSQLVTALHGRVCTESGVMNIFSAGFGQPNMGMPGGWIPPNGIPFTPQFSPAREKLDLKPEQIQELTEDIIKIQKRITEIISK